MSSDETFFLVTTFLNGPPDNPTPCTLEHAEYIQYNLYGTTEPEHDNRFSKVSRFHSNGRSYFFYCIPKTLETAQKIKARMTELINSGIYGGECEEIVGYTNLINTIYNYKQRFYT